MCNYSKFFKTTLQITDENIKILYKTEKIEINGCNHLVYYGVLEASPSSCTHCKKCEIGKNGYRKVKVKMPFISDHPAILYLNKQRFICKDCHKSFTADRKNSNTSKNLRASIIKKLSKEDTSKKIAESCAVSTNTVLRIQCDFGKT